MMRRLLKKITVFLGCLLIALSCIIAYGYWHAATHAQFHVTLNFKNFPPEKPLLFPKAQVIFLDSERHILASGKVDEKIHYVQLVHPEVGNCYEKAKRVASSKESRTIWQKCYKHLPSWVAQWVDGVHQVDFEAPDCTIKQIPIAINKYNSMWGIWWIPLPHVFGKPYSYYSANITIDQKKCKNE